MEGVKMTKPFLDRSEQADYLTQRGLKITRGQLTKLACIGGGPEYQIWGNRAVSTPEQLDAWVEKKLGAPRRSTSEAAKAEEAAEAEAKRKSKGKEATADAEQAAV
jgi:hypothetical protein